MPSCASTISTFFRRRSAKTSSCRIVGLSSTIKILCRSMFPPLASVAAPERESLREQVDESLDRVQLALRLRVQARREDGRRGVAAEQREQLVVERREPVLLLQQAVDRDRADRTLLDRQRNAHDRLAQIVGARRVPAGR